VNIVVCVKQVVDTEAEKRLDPGTWRLDRSVDAVLNPYDEYAVEEPCFSRKLMRAKSRSCAWPGGSRGRHPQSSGNGRGQCGARERRGSGRLRRPRHGLTLWPKLSRPCSTTWSSSAAAPPTARPAACRPRWPTVGPAPPLLAGQTGSGRRQSDCHRETTRAMSLMNVLFRRSCR